MRRSILTGFAVLCLLALPVHAQEAAAPPTKEQDIRRLLELMGSADLARQMVDQMFAEFQSSLPEMPAKFWEESKAEMNPQAFVDLAVPIYDKHFTQPEIRELIAFYETPIGRKLTQKLPAITQESMAAGMKWGEEIAQKVMARIEAQEEEEEEP
jgi:hypothetical protein